MTRSRLAASALVAVALCGCAPGDAGAPRLPLLVRAMCAIERWIERDDMRVRQEGVDHRVANEVDLAGRHTLAQEVLPTCWLGYEEPFRDRVGQQPVDLL